jgi:Fur family transcriptional regulator, ferric uptake regulator
VTARVTESTRQLFDSVEEAVSLLRDRGHRLSGARRQLLEALFSADRLVTAEELADGLEGRIPRSDVAVVYRNLETLEEVGLIRHVHLGHAAGRYALAGRRRREYLVCAHCGGIAELAADELDRVRRLIEFDFDFHASFAHFPITGICGACARAARRPAPERD